MSRTSRRGLSKPFVIFSVVVGAFAVAYAALFLAALSVNRSDVVTESYGEVRHLRIKGGHSGEISKITVVAEQRADVEVIARRTWSLQKPETAQSFRDGELTLSGSCGFIGTIGPRGCTVDFELRIPRTLRIDVRGASGDVVARDLGADAYVGASSGDVTVIDATGPLRVGVSSGDVTVVGYGGADVSAHASSGEVTVRTRAVPRRVEATASSGDVTVVVPGDVRYDVEARTTSGELFVELDQERGAPRRIDARTSSGDVRVLSLDDAR